MLLPAQIDIADKAFHYPPLKHVIKEYNLKNTDATGENIYQLFTKSVLHGGHSFGILSAIMRLKAAVWCATKTVNNPKHTVNKEQANMDRKNTQ